MTELDENYNLLFLSWFRQLDVKYSKEELKWHQEQKDLQLMGSVCGFTWQNGSKQHNDGILYLSYLYFHLEIVSSDALLMLYRNS